MTSETPTLLVLAAGMGARYGGLKQLAAVGPSGETLMDYAVYDAVRSGFSRGYIVCFGAVAKPYPAARDAGNLNQTLFRECHIFSPHCF